MNEQHLDAMTTLSPAAQAVLDACLDENYGDDLMPSELRVIAAALRAVAERCSFMDDDGCEMVSVIQLLAIAAELDGGAQ